MPSMMPRAQRARKARDTSVLASDPPNRAAVPLRALLPGASPRWTVRGPGALEWLSFLEARGAR